MALAAALHEDNYLQHQVETLQTELDQSRALIARLRQEIGSLQVTLLGMKADADEALGPIRFESAVASFKEGLRKAQKQVKDLKAATG